MSVLLERERELAELGATLEEVAAGKGCAVGIEAAAGLGKTRLLQEARGNGSDAGLRVLAGRATELEQFFPFALVRQLLGPEIAGLPADERERVLDGAGAARGALGMAAEDQRDKDAFAVLHALYWVTAALAERGPLLLAIDDAHSADAASLDYLSFLLPRLEELPILLVIAGRPDEPDTSGGFRRLMADDFIRHLPLNSLSSDATAALLADELGTEPEPPFAAACFEVSGGNPFLLRELSRTVDQRGIEPSAENAEQVRELVPERVAQTVLLRLGRLSPQARAVARSLAVFGDDAEPRLVVELAGSSAEGASLAADELRAIGILDPVSPLRFAHPLVRSAVYESIPVGERGRRHAEAAECMRRVEASPEQIGTQLLAAEERGAAEVVETLVVAGVNSLASGAPRSTIAYLSRALREPPPPELRPTVLEPMLTAISRTADQATWNAIEPEVLAELERDPSLRPRWAVALTTALAMGGRFEEAAERLVEAIEVAAEGGDFDSAYRLEAQLATLAQLVPSVPAVDLSDYADKIEPDSPSGRLAAAIEARTAVIDGSADEATEAAKRALGNDGIIFAEESELAASTLAVLSLIAADEMDAASHAADRALAIGRENGGTPELARGLYLRALVGWGYGDLVGAEADMGQALDLVRMAGIHPLVMMYASNYIEILVERDELKRAERELTDIGMAEGPIPQSPLFSLLLLARAELRFERGELDRCLEDCLELRAHSEAMGMGPGPAAMVCHLAARVLAAADEREQALELAEEMMRYVQRWGSASSTAHVMRAVAMAQGGEQGVETLEAAAHLMEGSPRRLEHAHVLADLGEARRRQGRRVDAREPLRSALELARKGGAWRVARRARDELQATGEKVRSYAPIGVESLTPSERRVAELAASGMTNRQIAQSLFVTVKTVEAHLSAAYDKLDIGSRKELPQFGES